jgi:hypothetical protein
MMDVLQYSYTVVVENFKEIFEIIAILRFFSLSSKDFCIHTRQLLLHFFFVNGVELHTLYNLFYILYSIVDE